MQKEINSIKNVKSLAQITQVFRVPRALMMRLLKRRLKYGALIARIPKGLKHFLLLFQTQG